MLTLTSLPFTVIFDILHEWVDIESLNSFDSSATNTEIRFLLIKSYDLPRFIINVNNEVMNSWSKWIMKRGIKLVLNKIVYSIYPLQQFKIHAILESNYIRLVSWVPGDACEMFSGPLQSYSATILIDHVPGTYSKPLPIVGRGTFLKKKIYVTVKLFPVVVSKPHVILPCFGGSRTDAIVLPHDQNCFNFEMPIMKNYTLGNIINIG